MPLLSVTEARATYARILHSLEIETVTTPRARGRTLAVDAHARVDLPAHTQSSMDGYAVRAADLVSASPTTPISLRVVGEAPAGRAPALGVGPGEACRIFTGGMLPDGSDAIAIQEEVERQSEHIVLRKAVTRDEWVRHVGTELRQGTRVVGARTRLNAGHLATLSAAGIDRVEVRRTPKVTVLVTGDEVIQPDASYRAGQVFDANTPLITGFVERWCIAPKLVYVRDDKEATSRALHDASLDSDLIITTGGVSVGDRDYVRPCSKELGFVEHFAGVAQKPGKPLVFATRGRCALLGIPGNTGAVFCCLAVHADVVMRLLVDEPLAPLARARLERTTRADASRELLLRCRVRLDEEGRTLLCPLEGQHSHFVAELGACDAVALLPPRSTPYEAQTLVDWISV